MSKEGKSTYKGNKRDQFTIVLEDIRSKFDFLADGILGLKEKADRTDQKLDQVDQKVSRLELKMDLGFLELKSDSKIVHNQLENHENRILSLENS